MKAAHSLPSRYALILDQTEIRKLLRKVEALDLPRRECHPLDRYNGRKVSSELARYDAAVDRGLVDDDLLTVQPVPAPSRRRVRLECDDDLGDEWDS
ncbi:MAG: hypothetical protein EXR28_10595 [Betaproteobacteria bacterium]|nr:hypothetical protein [Betaproteobacteria bacterium]